MKLIKVLILILISLGICQMEAIASGSIIPDFQVESGDGSKLTREEVKDHIVFIFYDHKDTFARNNEFKTELHKEYLELSSEEQDALKIVQIIDCSEASFLNKYFYKKSMISSSRKYGFTIWGDWDGSIKRSFRFQDKGSYLLIADTLGKVIYFDEYLFELESIEEISQILNVMIMGSGCGR